MHYELCIMNYFRESSSVDRALAFQAEGRGFESRLSLHKKEILTSVRISFFASVNSIQ